MKILGFSAKAGHGKDTCAKLSQEIMREEMGKALGIWSFAHPLKSLVYGENKGLWSFDDVWYVKPDHIRDRLQKRGTDEGRDVYGQNIWTLQSEAYLRLIDQWGILDAMAIPDVRFPNEVEFCKIGGLVADRLKSEAREEAMDILAYPDEEDEERILVESPINLYMLDLAVEDLTQLRYEGKKGKGLSVWIESDRPTLTGMNATHKSETAFDNVDKATFFDAIIVNNLDTTFEDLKDQLRPILKKLLEL